MYNIGSEEEYLGNIDRALINFSNACSVTEDNLGFDHVLS